MSEQISQGQPGDPYVYKLENGKYYFKGKEGTTNKDAQKYKDWYEAKADAGIRAIKALFDAGTNVTTTEIKPATQTDPNKEVQDITKQIQKLLGLPETGVMDSGLLQKINDKLNGGEKASTPASASTQSSASTQVSNFNIDPNIGKDGINFNQMTPEEKVQGVLSATPPQEPISATTPPTNKDKRQERRDLRKANRAEMQALRDKQRGNQ